MYEIGSMVWFRGDEYKITTEPYVRYGHEWQDAEGHGKVVALPTPEQTAANVAKQKAEYAEQQAGFRRLKELQNKR